MKDSPGTPSVSVVIPTRNEAPSVAETVRSARAAGADEVIVVDGESDDGTAAAAQGLADLVLACPPGRARQMNAGAAASRGEVLVFLHADTTLPEGAVAGIRAAVEDGAAGGAFCVNLGVSVAAPAARASALRLTAAMINLRSRLFRAYTGDQAIFVRRDVFESLGAYPEIPLMEDVEFSRRLTRRGRTVLLPSRITTSARRWEANGVARTILLMWGLRIAHRLGLPPHRCARFYGGNPGARRADPA